MAGLIAPDVQAREKTTPCPAATIHRATAGVGRRWTDAQNRPGPRPATTPIGLNGYTNTHYERGAGAPPQTKRAMAATADILRSPGVHKSHQDDLCKMSFFTTPPTSCAILCGSLPLPE